MTGPRFWVGYVASAVVIFFLGATYDFFVIVHGGYAGSIYLAGALILVLSTLVALIWWAIRGFRYEKGWEVLLVLWLAFIALVASDWNFPG